MIQISSLWVALYSKINRIVLFCKVLSRNYRGGSLYFWKLFISDPFHSILGLFYIYNAVVRRKVSIQKVNSNYWLFPEKSDIFKRGNTERTYPSQFYTLIENKMIKY
jgi:hypothetical protein